MRRPVNEARKVMAVEVVEEAGRLLTRRAPWLAGRGTHVGGRTSSSQRATGWPESLGWARLGLQ